MLWSCGRVATCCGYNLVGLGNKHQPVEAGWWCSTCPSCKLQKMLFWPRLFAKGWFSCLRFSSSSFPDNPLLSFVFFSSFVSCSVVSLPELQFYFTNLTFLCLVCQIPTADTDMTDCLWFINADDCCLLCLALQPPLARIPDRHKPEFQHGDKQSYSAERLLSVLTHILTSRQML